MKKILVWLMAVIVASMALAGPVSGSNQRSDSGSGSGSFNDYSGQSSGWGGWGG